MEYVMTSMEFVKKAKDIATNYKTLYVYGCLGDPMTPKNKIKHSKTYPFNRRPQRQNMIANASEDTFGFDCSGLVKSILWGWCGDKTKDNGGAKYMSNGVPDASANLLIGSYCSGVSTKFDNIEVGEFLWMSGHCGIYIGGGLAVECTPSWRNKVQITAVGNIGFKAGYNSRQWTKHGKLKFVDYAEKTEKEPIKETTEESTTYIVQKGDTLTKIAKKYKTTVKKLTELNDISDANLIKVGQELRVSE